MPRASSRRPPARGLAPLCLDDRPTPRACLERRDAVNGLPSTSRVRVRYADTDKMGVAYYANYFVWFEVGRTDLLRTSGWSYREMEAEGFSLPVIDAQCAYRAPARYDDELEVRTSGILLSAVRVKFTYEIVRTADQLTLATGTTVHAALNRHGRPSRLPERVRTVLS